MIKGSGQQQESESSIYDDLSLYKVVLTDKSKPLMIHKNGGCSVIIPFSGINNTAFNEQQFEELFKGIRRVVDDLTKGVVTLQFTACRTSNLNINGRSDLPSYLQPRADYFNELAANNKVFKNEYYISIFVDQPKVTTREIISDYFTKLIKKQNPLVEQYNAAFTSIDSRASLCFETMNQVLTMLRETGFTFRTLKTKDEYYSIIQTFTRPNKSQVQMLEIDDQVESPRQTVFSAVRSVAVQKDFTLDDYYHKVYTLDRAPRDYIYGRSLEVIHSIPYEYVYSVAFKSLTHKESNDVLRFRVAEQRIIAGTNENAIVEDRSKIAEEQRVSQAYDVFAFGNGGENTGLFASVNLMVKVKESLIDKRVREAGLSRSEVLRDIDYRLSKDMFPRFGSSEWISEDNTSWPVFCQMIPGMANLNAGVLKYLFLTSENIPYFLPLWDTGRPIPHDGVNHFIDERGNYITFDLMDPQLVAWNYYISGETGSGKSVLVNTLLTMQFAEAAGRAKPIVCILDVGGERGSYMKFMNVIKGSSINLSGVKKPHIQMFELNAELSLPTPKKVEDVTDLLLPFAGTVEREKLKVKVRNFFANLLDKGRNNLKGRDFEQLFSDCVHFPLPPEHLSAFDLGAGECEPTGKALNLIMGILEVILSSSTKVTDGFMQYDYDQVLELVMATYRATKGRYPYMTDFYELARDGNAELGVSGADDSKPKGKKFLTKIRNWTRGEGTYSMFDMDTDVDLTNDVILVDLKGLQNEPNLQLIYTLLFSELFSNKMYFTRGRRKLVIRDEAWSIMSNDKARKYLVEDLRTARKNGFATLTISQFPTDVMSPDPQDGKAILGNMQAHIVGLVRSEPMRHDVAQTLGLTDEMSEELKHLGQHKSLQADGSFRTDYSRFMLKIGDEIYLLRNNLHPFEAILYSSSEDDNAIIDYFMKETRQYDNLEDVLWLISRKQHVGNKGLLAYLENAGYRNAARSVRGDLA